MGPPDTHQAELAAARARIYGAAAAEEVFGGLPSGGAFTAGPDVPAFHAKADRKTVPMKDPPAGAGASRAEGPPRGQSGKAPGTPPGNGAPPPAAEVPSRRPQRNGKQDSTLLNRRVAFKMLRQLGCEPTMVEDADGVDASYIEVRQTEQPVLFQMLHELGYQPRRENGTPSIRVEPPKRRSAEEVVASLSAPKIGGSRSRMDDLEDEHSWPSMPRKRMDPEREKEMIKRLSQPAARKPPAAPGPPGPAASAPAQGASSVEAGPAYAAPQGASGGAAADSKDATAKFRSASAQKEHLERLLRPRKVDAVDSAGAAEDHLRKYVPASSLFSEGLPEVRRRAPSRERVRPSDADPASGGGQNVLAAQTTVERQGPRAGAPMTWPPRPGVRRPQDSASGAATGAAPTVGPGHSAAAMRHLSPSPALSTGSSEGSRSTPPPGGCSSAKVRPSPRLAQVGRLLCNSSPSLPSLHAVTASSSSAASATVPAASAGGLLCATLLPSDAVAGRGEAAAQSEVSEDTPALSASQRMAQQLTAGLHRPPRAAGPSTRDASDGLPGGCAEDSHSSTPAAVSAAPAAAPEAAPSVQHPETAAESDPSACDGPGAEVCADDAQPSGGAEAEEGPADDKWLEKILGPTPSWPGRSAGKRSKGEQKEWLSRLAQPKQRPDSEASTDNLSGGSSASNAAARPVRSPRSQREHCARLAAPRMPKKEKSTPADDDAALPRGAWQEEAGDDYDEDTLAAADDLEALLDGPREPETVVIKSILSECQGPLQPIREEASVSLESPQVVQRGPRKHQRSRSQPAPKNPYLAPVAHIPKLPGGTASSNARMPAGKGGMPASHAVDSGAVYNMLGEDMRDHALSGDENASMLASIDHLYNQFLVTGGPSQQAQPVHVHEHQFVHHHVVRQGAPKQRLPASGASASNDQAVTGDGEALLSSIDQLYNDVLGEGKMPQRSSPSSRGQCQEVDSKERRNAARELQADLEEVLWSGLMLKRGGSGRVDAQASLLQHLTAELLTQCVKACGGLKPSLLQRLAEELPEVHGVVCEALQDQAGPGCGGADVATLRSLGTAVHAVRDRILLLASSEDVSGESILAADAAAAEAAAAAAIAEAEQAEAEARAAEAELRAAEEELNSLALDDDASSRCSEAVSVGKRKGKPRRRSSMSYWTTNDLDHLDAPPRHVVEKVAPAVKA
eukprot:TRINITY_DN51733_c0_g1_i1.p1 TRINITY_DN51733_c0_g1~~TRINITY_DN51733_c0_g1_i1.p1  ORF type:complete len:1191 (-),score=318.97 TRINITY_DN51733_c0_g1_i1:263-3835(-)